MRIGRLAHVAIGVNDADAMARFYGELLGVVEVARGESVRFLAGGRKPGYDVALGPWPRGLHHFALQAASSGDLDAARERLARAGVEAYDVDLDAEHGIEAGIAFALPSGHLVELVVLQAPRVFESTTTIDARHAAGAGPVPLEHITLNCDDVEATATFLTEVLGLRLTEVARPAGGPWFNAFVRCRDLHHDIGLFHNHSGSGPGLDHYGFQVPSVDGIVRVADGARRLGTMLECSPGRHLAGDNIFIYLADPEGNRIEVSTPLAPIDGAAPPRIFEARHDEEWRGIFDAWRENIPKAVRTPNPCFDARAGASR